LLRLSLASAVAVPLTACGGEDAPAPAGDPDEPRPVEAVSGIVAAFGRRPIVAVGETHGNTQLHEFAVRLVQDRRLRAVTRTIAVEVSSSAQDVIDAYVDERGADDTRLLDALRDGIFSETGGADPRELDLYRAVRDANRAAPAAERLRVLATDAPLSWKRITGPGGLAAIDRESAMARSLDENVLAQGRTALWIVGASHLRPGRFPVRPSGATDGNAPGMARGLLEARRPHSVYEIRLYTGFGERTAELERRMRGWPVPGIVAADRGWLRTALAGELGGDLLTGGGAPSDAVTGGDTPPGPGTGIGSGPDTGLDTTGSDTGLDTTGSDVSPAALLYLGTWDSLTPLVPDPRVFEDPVYRAELDRRYRLAGRGRFDPDAYLRTVRSLFDRP
jgi:hypothetical protein